MHMELSLSTSPIVDHTSIYIFLHLFLIDEISFPQKRKHNKMVKHY